MTRPTFKTCAAAALTGLVLVCCGCIKPKFSIFPEADEPLKEYKLQGEASEKILVVPIKGFISESRRDLPFYRKPSTVQEIVSQLNKAEKDARVKAVILKIDSPGGSVTASDMLYHEIMKYKEASGAKVVAAMMSVAASGGYYAALSADYILAHPTSIVGSVGVILLRPNVSGLMGKIGLEVNVDKSGKSKDMGSPFRKATPEEQQILQGVIDDFAGRFIDLAASRRKLSEEAKADVSTARVYTAADALKLGLIDEIGYIDDAFRKTKSIAGLPEDAKIVVYRRTEYPDDNVYNTSAEASATPEVNLINLELAESMPPVRSGFYYLWLPGGAD